MGRRAAVLFAVVISLLGVGATTIPARGSTFCSDGVVRDYAKPLQAMPAIRPLPVDERLPFGPSRVFVGQSNEAPLLVGPSQVGFHLSFSPFGAGRFSGLLNWLVEVRVASVDRQGHTRKLIASWEERVKRLRAARGADLSLEAEIARPGLYRTELVVSDLRSGKRLGRYGTYQRLLRPSLDAALVLNGSSFRPGETVSATLVNRGTETIGSGLSFGIEAFDGSAWAPSPIHRSGPVPAIALATGPGKTSTCWHFQIPAEPPAGLYRFTLGGDASRGFFDREPTAVPLSAEFTILAGP